MTNDFKDATPEKLKILETKRDNLKLMYEAVATECREMRAALGMDNPENLTYANRIFFELADTDPGYCTEYQASQPECDAELRELAAQVAKFEAEGGTTRE